jgi:uncharacterized protein YcbX
MITVATLFRHPIKGVGRERITSTSLGAGKTMPHDRLWAVLHETGTFNSGNPVWEQCGNFIRGAGSPLLQTLGLETRDDDYIITPPGGDPFRFNPEDPADQDRFIAWVSQFVPDNRAQPVALVRAPDRGMTDTSFASVSIMGNASLADLSQKTGQPVLAERFRGNIWLDGLSAWQEFDWIDKTIRIGTAQLVVQEPLKRCMSTAANTTTGIRDIAMLDQLKTHYNHTNFGIAAKVVKPGTVTLNDKVEIL